MDLCSVNYLDWQVLQGIVMGQFISRDLALINGSWVQFYSFDIKISIWIA